MTDSVNDDKSNANMKKTDIVQPGKNKSMEHDAGNQSANSKDN